MKQINFFKKLAICAVLGISGSASAQITYHPLAFGAMTTGGQPNWYYNYVGERFIVTTPMSVAGEKIFTTPNDGSGATGAWGGVPVGALAITNDTLMLPQAGDSLAGSAISVDMTGKVALVYRGGGIEFGFKATQAQNAGAKACVIINNVDGGPVGMGAGSYGGTVTIPVFMISKTDGAALKSIFLDGGKPTITVCFWGMNNLDDIGFISSGISQWHNGAIPYNQFAAGASSVPYWGMDGAYIANYGQNNETNVKLVAKTSFTPTGGSTTQINADSVTLASFPELDSIWALYPSQYALGGITGNGTVQVDYSLSMDAIDQFLYDNVTSYSFSLTDNVFCKGRYNMAANQPFATFYTGSGTNSGGTYDPYIWGPTYYVARGCYIDSVQFSLLLSSSTGITWLIGGPMNTYIFKWVDGLDFGAGTTFHDSLIENGELQLVGVATKTFDGITDSSFKFYSVAVSDSTGATYQVSLDSSSWYYVAAEMASTGGTGWFIGCDGVNNGYIRQVGRALNSWYYEYYAPVWSVGNRNSAGTTMWDNLNFYLAPAPYGGTAAEDSVIFSSQKGLIPNIAMKVSDWPEATKKVQPTSFEFNLYPNPATTYVNVGIGLQTSSKEVVYTVLNTSGQVVSKETHYNVLNETYTLNTEKMPAGNYFMVVNANGKAMFKKFTVVK